MKKKGGFSKSTGQKAMSQGPVIKKGSGVGGSSIPRAGYHPGGERSARRFDKSVDYHSVDRRDPNNRGC